MVLLINFFLEWSMDIHIDRFATLIEQVTEWDEVESLLPRDWREIAVATNALKGLRQDKSPDNLLHVLLLHFACGMSLRETVVTAKLSNLGISAMWRCSSASGNARTSSRRCAKECSGRFA